MRHPRAVVSIVVLGLVTVTGVALAAARGLPPSNVGVELAVTPSKGTAGQYVATAVVTDLRSGQVLAKPRLVFEKGSPAEVKSTFYPEGDESANTIVIDLAVDGSGSRATYSWHHERNGEVLSSQHITISLE